MSIDKLKLQKALLSVSERDFTEAAKDLLDILGYRSERVPLEQSGTAEDFVAMYPPVNKRQDEEPTKSEKSFVEHAQSVRILFQLTDSELGAVAKQNSLFNANGFDEGEAKSFVFTSVEMGGGGRRFFTSGNLRRFSSGDKQKVFHAHCSIV